MLKFTKAVLHLRKNKSTPFIEHMPNQPPSISNAQWKSRAIFPLFAELLKFNDDRILAVNTLIVEDNVMILLIFENLFSFFLFRLGLQRDSQQERKLIGVSCDTIH